MLMTAIEATVATMAVEEEMERQRQIEEERKRQEFLLASTRSVQLCENQIAALIESAIQHGYRKICAYVSNDTDRIWIGRIKDGVARLLEKDGCSYSDGTESRTDKGMMIAPDVIIDYLTAHGYGAKWVECAYRNYGTGYWTGYQLEISWGI